MCPFVREPVFPVLFAFSSSFRFPPSRFLPFAGCTNLQLYADGKFSPKFLPYRLKPLDNLDAIKRRRKRIGTGVGEETESDSERKTMFGGAAVSGRMARWPIRWRKIDSGQSGRCCARWCFSFRSVSRLTRFRMDSTKTRFASVMPTTSVLP